MRSPPSRTASRHALLVLILFFVIPDGAEADSETQPVTQIDYASPVPS
jgi:hypothetical protein